MLIHVPQFDRFNIYWSVCMEKLCYFQDIDGNEINSKCVWRYFKKVY